MVNYKIGEPVWVRNQKDSPKLTILSINDNLCECTWFDNNKKEYRKTYPLDSLAKEEPKIIFGLPPSLIFRK